MNTYSVYDIIFRTITIFDFLNHIFLYDFHYISFLVFHSIYGKILENPKNVHSIKYRLLYVSIVEIFYRKSLNPKTLFLHSYPRNVLIRLYVLHRYMKNCIGSSNDVIWGGGEQRKHFPPSNF